MLGIHDDYRKTKLPVFFLDETGILNKPDDPYFALGVIKTERPHELQRAVKIIRDKCHYYEEIKWNKMSPLKYDICLDFIRSFISDRCATFSCTILRKADLDFATYFQNDLLKVYKSFSVLLLKANIDSQLNEVCTVLADDYFYPEGTNLELTTRAIINDHYKKLVVSGFVQINSKSSDLLQLTDLLLGATIYDLKITENKIQRHPNLKFKTLEFLHSKFGVMSHSFFRDKNEDAKEHFFYQDKFKVSIFKPKKDIKGIKNDY